MRTRLTVLTAAALVAVVMVCGGVASAQEGPTAAAKKTKTISFSKNFSNTQTITIPLNPALPLGADINANPYPSQIHAALKKSLRKAKVTDVNLRLNGFTHTFPDDVDILLAHGGKTATIFSDVGGSTDVSGLSITLNQQASTPLPDLIDLTSGTFKPTDVEIPDIFGFDAGLDNFPAPAPLDSGQKSLSAFNGTRAFGAWKLFITDDFGMDDQGQISSGWTLQIKAKARVRR